MKVKGPLRGSSRGPKRLKRAKMMKIKSFCYGYSFKVIVLKMLILCEDDIIWWWRTHMKVEGP